MEKHGGSTICSKFSSTKKHGGSGFLFFGKFHGFVGFSKLRSRMGLDLIIVEEEGEGRDK